MPIGIILLIILVIVLLGGFRGGRFYGTGNYGGGGLGLVLIVVLILGLGRVLALRFQPCTLSVGGTAPSAALDSGRRVFFLANWPWPPSHGVDVDHRRIAPAW